MRITASNSHPRKIKTVLQCTALFTITKIKQLLKQAKPEKLINAITN
jgi:hypothetical protein